MPAQAPRGCCPERAASRAYRPASRARRPCIGGRSGNPGKSPQRCKALRRLLREQGTRAGRSRQACRTPAAALVQKAPKTALGRAAAPTQVHQAQLRHRRGAAGKEAGKSPSQAGRDHEAQEQGAACAADDRAGRDAVRRRHPPGGEMRGSGFPEGPGRLSSARRPARLSTLRRAGRRCGCRASMGGGMSAVRINDSADREPTAAGRFAHEAIAQRMVPGHGFLRHGARRGHADRGHGPKRGVGIDRRRAAKRR